LIWLPEPLSRVLPAEVTKVEQYFGSFVRFDCLSEKGEVFSARLYLTDWLFFEKGLALADSAGSAESNNAHLSRLKGEKLKEVLVRGASELWLMFTNEMSLKLTANLSEYEFEDEMLIASLDDVYLKFSPANGFVGVPSVRNEH
jgi:hypothetical protein